MIKTQTIQTNFTAGELSPKLAGRVDISKYFNSAETLENQIVIPFGGAVRRSGTYFVAESKSSGKQCRLVPFQFSTTQAYIIEFGDFYCRFYKDSGQIVSGGSAYEISTPYKESDLFDLEFAQSADTLYIAHKDYAPRKLTRTGHTAWTLSKVDFINGPYMDDNLTNLLLAGSATTGSITVTASCPAWATTTVYRAGDYVTNSETTYICKTSHTSGTFATDLAEGYWTAQAIAMFQPCHVGAFIRIKTGWVQITAYSSATVVTALVRGTLADTGTTTDWAEGAFSAVRGYPRAVTFFEQRLFWGGTTNNPQTVWGSKSQSFEDHSVSEPVVDDDAVNYTIYSEQVNTIEWFMAAKTLHIGTSGGTYKMDSGSSAALSPTNVVVQRETTYAAAHILPKKIGNYIYYVQKDTRHIREISYQFQSDSYVAVDATILADHITESGIKDIEYVQSPYNMLFCVRNDGEIAVLTREIEQEVTGWSRLVTDGDFESVASIPNGEEDQIWVVVNRTINGVTKRFIEYFKTLEFGDDQEDCYFVDCGLTYDGAAVTSISGLTHLAGETVQILADGAVHQSKVVPSTGIVTLDYSASVVHAGLGFTSKILQNKSEVGTTQQTSQGKIKRITKATIRFYKSLGCKYGSEDSQDRLPFRDSSMDMDAPPALFTGDKVVQFPVGYNRDGQVYIEQDQPLPLHILSIIPHISIFDG